ncbi:MAG: 4-(cytidine 5'-diphospho)-2-C-methyl-D-erythritol kinase, partial [Roseimicrobium sp.]
MPDSRISLLSHAKVNLSLRILGKRADGFHEVTTRMCPISLADEVVITTTDGPTELTCSDAT